MYYAGQEEIDAVATVLKSGQFFRHGGFGPGHLGETAVFEREYAAAMGVPHCLALTSGTSSLLTALAALEIGPGDEVIVPAFTFVSTAYAVLAVGAVPVLAEVDETLTIDVDDVRSKITGRTRAVLPVHMTGLPCDMDGLLALAKQTGIRIVEDACQCVGGTYRGRRVGSIGDAGCFSFNWFKILSCGEGGALITKDARLFERAHIFHDPGSEYWGPGRESGKEYFSGMNFRFNEILAAVMRVQLRRLDGWIATMKNLRREWRRALNGHLLLRPIRMHDDEGGASTHLFFAFENEESARSFVESATKLGLSAYRPYDTGRHIYDKWDAVLHQRGLHSTAANPFLHPAVRGVRTYSPDDCPETLKQTKQTVAVALSPLWSPAEQESKLGALRRAAAQPSCV